MLVRLDRVCIYVCCCVNNNDLFSSGIVFVMVVFCFCCEFYGFIWYFVGGFGCSLDEYWCVLIGYIIKIV